MCRHAEPQSSDDINIARIAFTLNSEPRTISVQPSRSLLEVLRDDLGITSPKNGCAPQAQCGCCTVLIDGKPKLACGLKIGKVAGRRVTTAEGLGSEWRQQLADSFTLAGATQCGYCMSGIAMRTVALLTENPNPSRGDIAQALRWHLCRCTGYVKIVDAIELLAQLRRGEPLPAPASAAGVGARRTRYHGRELVLGDYKFVDDLTVPNMAYAALCFSDHPRALVNAISTERAAAAPGVIRVVTAEDIPGERYVGLIAQDWPVLVAVGEETRCVGDVLAVVVAETRQQARDAAKLVDVDYEIRPPVTTPQQALQPDAPSIHPNGNLLGRSVVRHGDVDSAFGESAHVVEQTFTTQRIEHLFLEPEACLVVPELNENHEVARLQVYSQSQGVFDDRRQIASLLNWPQERIHVQLVSTGGGFGGKEDLSVQGQTALAAVLCGRPVKCALTRPESIRLHPKRHPLTIDIKAACDADGRLTAVRARMLGDTGAYASVGAKVLERAAGHATGPYRVPHVDIESKALHTNNPPCGAMRGFGVNQAAFAMEGCLDLLAERVGIDGWDMRWRNAVNQGDRLSSGQPLDKPIGLKRCLEAVRDVYKNARYAGIACGVKNVGIGNGMPDLGKATIHIDTPDRITIRTGFTEMGQGYFTLCIQIACQETGLSPEFFHVQTDTSAELNCGQTTASRATVLGGSAVRDAARKLRAELDAGRSPADLVTRTYRGDFVCNDTTPLGADVANPKLHLTYGYAAQVAILDDNGHLQKIVAAHDVGRAMNPMQLEGQIEGSVHMGLGYALTEELIVEGGHIQNKDINSIGVLRAHQMPEVDVIIIEEPDPETAYGARGVGEIGLVPTAPAVAGALAAFDGIHRTTLPMRNAPAAQAIRDHR